VFAVLASSVTVAAPAAEALAVTAGVDLVLVTGGLSTPVDVAAPPGDDRIFVVEKAGRIRIVRDGVALATPFLDISGPVLSSGNEQGLLGLAFDPNYDRNGRFYVAYTGDAGSGDSFVARYKVSADPDRAAAGSGKVLLRVGQPFTNHNGGQVAIGPDGYLYASFGDGGSGGDPNGNGQNRNTLLGSIVRIDRVTGDPAPDNPFVGSAGADEIWAWGLRNPWRFTFDTATGDMYIGDVGQSAWEEVDVAPAGVGGLNFGWNEREGRHCYLANCQTAGLTEPVVEYAHNDAGCSGSITGGKVYRGNDLPWLRGHFFYADYCTGIVRSFRYVDGAVEDSTGWNTALGPPGSIRSFGSDGHGELYVVAGSSLYRLVSTRNPACDFDGDGDADLAAGARGEDRTGAPDAGMVQVFSGASGGIAVADDARFFQGEGGVAGLLEGRDQTGAALACGDFDGDGYADLAVGAPGETIGGLAKAGAVHVLYGGPGGLSGNGDQMWRQGSGGVKGEAERRDQFGAALASGDFDGDGFDDLAVGAPGERIAGARDAGTVNVLYGGGSGLGAAGNMRLDQAVAGVLDEAETGDRFGAALASGDFDGDGAADLAVGVPAEAVSGTRRGMVHVFAGGGTGLTTDDAVWYRGKASVDGAPANDDLFGWDLAAGHVDGDGFDDLAVGVPGSGTGGSVTVLHGGPGGVTGRDLRLRQGAGGLPGAGEANDAFGTSVALGDFDGDGYDDLAVGAPGESRGGNRRSGDVTVVFGSGDGLAGGSAQLWHQGRAALAGDLVTRNAFGIDVSVVDVNGDGRDDLAVAAEATLTTRRGALHLIPGSAGGLTGAGDVRWNQDTAGVLGVARDGDRFGVDLP
jgi:glucose/arabinose dehydrogenase